MATIRKRNDKYEVQVRRIGLPHLSKTFHVLKDAQGVGAEHGGTSGPQGFTC